MVVDENKPKYQDMDLLLFQEQLKTSRIGIRREQVEFELSDLTSSKVPPRHNWYCDRRPALSTKRHVLPDRRYP
jgi:hypothetical protein